MYSLDINFLKDRTERPAEERYVPARTQQNQRPVYVGLAAAVFPLALVLGAWWFLGFRNRALEDEIAELDTQLATVQALQAEVDSINGQVEALNTDSQALATVFDRIKPWSAILQDVQDRVPAGVQLSRIEQTQPAAPPPSPEATPTDGASPAAVAAVPPPPPSQVAITGYARSFSDVNDFLLTLQRSPFLQGAETRLATATLIDNPTTIEFADENTNQIEVELPQVVQYTIESSLTDLPASDLLQDLERNLAVGLAARIEALRDKGVLTP
jgi:type IV pilus assembly protein PilN